MRFHQCLKPISRILIFAMLHLCWFTSYGWAEMVPTETANPSQVETDRQRLFDLLNRQEVMDELEKYGISKVEAVARINSLSDEEITKIAGKLNELPPGGYGGTGLEIILIPIFLVAMIFVSIYCLFPSEGWGECFEFKMGEVFSMNPEQDLSSNENTVPEKEEIWCQRPDTNEWIPCEEQQHILNLLNRESIDCKSECNSKLSDCVKTRGLTNKSEEQCKQEKQICVQECPVMN